MREILGQWRVATTYMGAVIGAGFASGQEIMQFFVSYQSKGFGAVLIAIIILGLFGSITVCICRKHSITSYERYLIYLFGKKAGRIFDVIISISLWLGLATMVAGSSAVFKEYLGIPIYTAIAVNTISLFLSLVGREKGIIWLNSLLVPILIIITVMVIVVTLQVPGTTSIIDLEVQRPAFGLNWWISGFLYGSYNLVLGTVVLSTLGSREVGGPVLGSLLMGILIGGMFIALNKNYSQLIKLEIPMLYLASLKYSWLRFLYVFVLWFSMLTTAAANAFSLASRNTQKVGGAYVRNLLLVILISIPISLLGFSSLVQNFYPLLGIIGIPLIFFLVIKQVTVSCRN